MRKTVMIAALAAVGFVASSSFAGSVNFGNNSSSKAYSYSFTDSDGIGIVATADSNNPQQNAKVSQSKPGLGVDSGTATYYKKTKTKKGYSSSQSSQSDKATYEINHSDFSETLWLTFDTDVIIESLKLSNVGTKGYHGWSGADSYRLIDADGLELASGMVYASNQGTAQLDLSGLGSLNKIGIQAVGYEYDCKTYYSSFDVAGLCTVTAIPLPTAAWSGLGMLGLLGAGALRKKGMALVWA